MTQSSSWPNLNVASWRFIDWGSSACPTLSSTGEYSSAARPRHYWPTTTRAVFARWGLSSKRTFELKRTVSEAAPSLYSNTRSIQFCCFVIFNASSFDLSPRIFEGTFAEGNSLESFTHSLWMIFPGETNRETRCLEDFRGINVGEEIGLKNGLWQVRQVIERIPEWKFCFVRLWCFLSILILFCIFKSVKSLFPSWEERWRYFCENRIWWIVLFTKFRAVTDHVNLVASFQLFYT